MLTRFDNQTMFPLYNRFHLLRTKTTERKPEPELESESKAENHLFVRLLPENPSKNTNPQLQILYGKNVYTSTPSTQCIIHGMNQNKLNNKLSLSLLSFILCHPNTTSSISSELHIYLRDVRSLQLHLTFILNHDNNGLINSLLYDLHSSLLTSVYATTFTSLREDDDYTGVEGVKRLCQVPGGVIRSLRGAVEIDKCVVAAKALCVAALAKVELDDQVDRVRRTRLKELRKRRHIKNIVNEARQRTFTGIKKRPAANFFDDDDDDDEKESIASKGGGEIKEHQQGDSNKYKQKEKGKEEKIEKHEQEVIKNEEQNKKTSLSNAAPTPAHGDDMDIDNVDEEVASKDKDEENWISKEEGKQSCQTKKSNKSSSQAKKKRRKVARLV